MKSKRILLTGGAGFIGSHLADAYIEQGHEVVVVDDLSTGKPENLNPQARFIQADLRDPATLRVLDDFEFDLLNHQAAQADLGKSVKDPEFDEAVNVRASFQLLQKAVDRGIPRVVFASSGGGIYGEPEFVPQTEEHPTKAPTPYGAAKLVVEHYLNYLRQVRKLSCVCLRYANVYGPRQRGDGEAGVVSIFLTQILGGSPLTINGDGDQTRDFIFVQDVVRANMFVSDSEAQGSFNVGTGRETSINEIAENLEKLSGRSVEKIWRREVFAGQRRSVLDARKLRELASLPESTSLEAGLRRTVEWFGAAGGSGESVRGHGSGRIS